MYGRKAHTVIELTDMLEAEYMRWKRIYTKGCSDPTWRDGMNLNLVRNHIVAYKQDLEEVVGNRLFLLPDVYYWREPPVVSQDFMAVDRYLPVQGCTAKATPNKIPFEKVYLV
jgi:hypothetical protein